MIRRFLPTTSERGGDTNRFELALAVGPNAIGVTGDNSYEALYGREWLLTMREDRLLRLYQESATTPGEWSEVTTALPSFFATPLSPDARQIALAFDQSARVVVVFEDAGLVKITRWDAITSAYVQNVTFGGHDPVIIIDAAVADPRGYPEPERTAYFDWGDDWRVLFRWIPDGQIRENAVPDSDVVVFYLSSDRTTIRARVQRQLYGTVHTLFIFEAPIVLDQATAVFGRYQLLVSRADGVPHIGPVTSTPYIDQFMLQHLHRDTVNAAVAPETIRAENDSYNADDDDTLTTTVTPETIQATGDTYPAIDDDALDATVAPETIEAINDTYPENDDDALDATVAPETIEAITTTVLATDDDALDATVTPEAIRVQTV